MVDDPQETGVFFLTYGNNSDQVLNDYVIEDVFPDGLIMNSQITIQRLGNCLPDTINYTVDIILSDGTYLPYNR